MHAEPTSASSVKVRLFGGGLPHPLQFERLKMINEQEMSTEKRLSSNSGNGIGVGVALGAAFGAVYGASSGNMGQSLAMCIALGTAFGAVFDWTQRGNLKPKTDGETRRVG